MSAESGPSHFQALFEAAFRDYEKLTGKTLANHPLAEKLQSCDSVESVIAVLREQTEASNEIRGRDRVLKPLKNVLSVLHELSSSSAVDFGQHFGMPLSPVKAIHTGLGILFSAVKGVLDDYDTLADLLESVELFLNRLNIYIKIPPTVSMTEIIVKILVELLSIFALATKQIQQGKLKALIRKRLLRGKDIEAVLQRLDRLTADEARITAAQTLEVVHGLFRNMRDVVDDGQTSINYAWDALKIMQELASDMNKSKRDKLEKDIQSWLLPPDPWKNYHIARKLRHSESAAWFVQGNTFSEWKRSEAPDSLLWVHGKPGAGKSVLCSAIVEDIDAMRKAGLVSMAFFYCDFREEQKRDMRGLLSSLLVQLCHQSDSYCDVLSKFYFEHANGSRYPGDDALAGCLKDLLKLPGHAPVFLIIDALDECPNASSIPSPRSDVLNLLKELIKSEVSTRNLRICVTSRPEVDIKDAIDPLIQRSVSLHDEHGQKNDIGVYITSVVNTDSRNKRWKAEDKRLVIDVLTRKADGMFRWVYCQLVEICGCIPARIRHALADLPETLDETYERTLREIKKANWEFAHRLFQFVAVAVHPLRVEELAELLAFDFKAGSIPKFHEDWRPEDPMDAILSTCPSFFTIVDHETFHSHLKLVQFSHFSVKEFLTSARLADSNNIVLRRYLISETPAHTLAARACLGYLLHLDKDVTSDSLRKLPFTDYVEHWWADHARLEGVSRNVKDGLKELFDPSKPHLEVCIWLCDPSLHSWKRRRRRSERPTALRGTPLHYVALWDLHSIVKLLVNELSQDVNSQSFTNSATPLHLASSKGYMRTARRLLECGADVNAQNKDEETPLHLASKGGHLDVARMLIVLGGTESIQDKDGRTPLHLSLQAGRLDVVRMFIKRGAGVSAQDKDGQTPLHLALQERRLDVMEVPVMLIERGAGVSTQNKDGQTPLHLALHAMRLDVVRMLIERDAGVSTQDKDGRTPLHLALQARRLDIVRMLIEREAGVSTQDNDGRTPLHLALQARRLDIVGMLIKRGADVSAENKDGQTLSHLVSQAEQLDAVRMLDKHDVDMSAQDRDGHTSLHLASRKRQLEQAYILIERSAGVSAQNKDGQTPPHLALQARLLDIVRMLIERGADVSAGDKDGQTLLHLASQAGQIDAVRMLIEHGADMSAQDKDGQTPLLLALRMGHREATRMLIERGASVSAQNKDGQTPLHMVFLRNRYTQSGTLVHPEVPRMLIERGASVSAQNKDGQTSLHLASKVGRLYVVRMLIERGADVSAKDKDGQTPLHLASQVGRLDVVRILLERDADVSAENRDGQTPMHLASQAGQLEVIRMLLVHGANTAAQN